MIATIVQSADSFIDKLTLQPFKILDSDDASKSWSRPNAVDYFHLDESIKAKLKRYMRDSYDQGTTLRRALLAEGYDCIRYKNNIEDVGDYSYIVLDPSIITSVENNTLITFRSLFPNLIQHVKITDLTPADMILMTNGMYDVGIARFLDYYRSDDQYEITGKIIRNLKFSTPKHKRDAITNMFTHSDEVEVVIDIPDVMK